MFPPKLTPEQKEHAKMAERSNAHVGNTWNIFMMYLQMDKTPEVALELAEKAMEVWIPWEDGKVMEYPDVEGPTIMEQAQQIGEGIALIMGKKKDDDNFVEAFIPEKDGEEEK